MTAPMRPNNHVSVDVSSKACLYYRKIHSQQWQDNRAVSRMCFRKPLNPLVERMDGLTKK
eukprot:scaffold600812_cov19-Prasinocladus_malaysianus.AAC.1